MKCRFARFIFSFMLPCGAPYLCVYRERYRCDNFRANTISIHSVTVTFPMNLTGNVVHGYYMFIYFEFAVPIYSAVDICRTTPSMDSDDVNRLG